MLYLLFFVLLATASCKKCASGSKGSATTTGAGTVTSGFGSSLPVEHFQVENSGAGTPLAASLESGRPGAIADGNTEVNNTALAISNAAGGNAATGNTATGNTATGNTATGNTATGNTATGNTAVGNTEVNNTAIEDAAAGNTEVNNTAIGNAAGGNAVGGNAGVGIVGGGALGGGAAGIGGAGGGASNPFAGYNVLVDPLFKTGAGGQSCALKPSFSWVNDAADANKITGYVQTAKTSGPKYIVPLAIYAIPNRDCGGGASAGGAAGIGGYQALIDQIKTKIDPTVRTVIVLEPDALPQLISNQCGGATAQTYKDGIAYALKTLNAENVFIYVDGGNGDWLGSPDRIQALTTMLLGIWTQAGKPQSLRGISTNVSNYRPWKAGSSGLTISKRSMADESAYVTAVSAAFTKVGLPAHFITDTSRNGKPINIAPGFPCNLKGAGLGVPYTTQTGMEAEDAFIWIKTPGQSDGSGSTPACALPQSQPGAPAAGAWFPGLWQAQLQNAVPSAKQCGAQAGVSQERRKRKRREVQVEE